MAKKKKSDEPCMPTTWRPPTPQQERKSAAEHAARVAIEHDPQIKKRKDEIVEAVLSAMTHKSE